MHNFEKVIDIATNNLGDTRTANRKPVHQTIPDACKSCSNHPSNGGSGVCHCTLGTPEVKC